MMPCFDAYQDSQRIRYLPGSKWTWLTVALLISMPELFTPARAAQLTITVDKPTLAILEGGSDFAKFTVTNVSTGTLIVLGPTSITPDFIFASDPDISDADRADPGLSSTMPNTCFGPLAPKKSCVFSEFLTTEPADPKGGDLDSGVTQILTDFGFREPGNPTHMTAHAPAVDIKVTDTPVPEPSTWLGAILAFAGGGIFLNKRARDQRRA